ncbi:unnamed protein product [Lupinus luteus]|uniref:Uncharacterized protein n=1 Tax=Lupinus luteus TaxID=3873 RepID=A0AAV1XJ58_LUPLU
MKYNKLKHTLRSALKSFNRQTQSFFKMGETWIDGSVDDSQAKWDKGAWQWQWHFLRAMNAVINQCLIPLTKNNAQYLLLLYASCYCFCQQAVTESYAKQVTMANGNTDYIDGFYESSSMINGH